MSYIVRPIVMWPGKPTASYARRRSPFRAGWTQTSTLLDRELAQQRARQVVLQMYVRERDIRNDGMIRADARPDQPGVVLSFEGKYGPVQMPCDRFFDWQDNVRAIALSLEALRTVDRYGVTQKGEQYAGWKALPAAAGVLATPEEAARLIAKETGWDTPDRWSTPILNSAEQFQSAYRAAAQRVHPDKGGMHEAWITLQRAVDILKRHHGMTS